MGSFLGGEKMKNKVFDKMLSYLSFFLLIGLFVWEFSVMLAIAHIDAVHECQASNCQIESLHAER